MEFKSDGCYSGVKLYMAFSKPPFPDDYPQNATFTRVGVSEVSERNESLDRRA